MKVLALASYPEDAAATRFRIAQYIEPLREKGVEIELRPFLDSRRFSSLYAPGSRIRKAMTAIPSVLGRLRLLAPGDFDVLFVQREAMPFGPPVLESLLSTFRDRPLVLDLDDATYIPYESPSFGKLGSLLKYFGKTDRLIDRSEVVICGNRYIADHVESRGRRALVLPTTVDDAIFKPVEKYERIPVVGWIGTHSTFPLLEKMFPLLQDLSRSNRFKLRVIGSGRREIRVPGVEVETIDWNLEREPFDFADIDIGLYPLSAIDNAPAEWIAGKSGFKAIQYLAVGIPFVMTPIGVCATIGRHGVTHFNAESELEWTRSLQTLLSDFGLRRKMGGAGRELFLAEYNLASNITSLVEIFSGFRASP
jgi:glycosyltransferase involved in cell wall biosynthesis